MCIRDCGFVMRKILLTLITIWISTGMLSGCVSSKAKVFGDDMPTMKTIHDEKFSKFKDNSQMKLHRAIYSDSEATPSEKEFHWLPNPTLTMYVFKHLSPAGYPVPGYSTFFRLYTQDHIAAPGEQGGWE